MFLHCKKHYLCLTVVSLYAGTSSASLFEGLNRVVGDGLSAQDWFATKKAEAVPVKLPWEASTAEELPYERYAVHFAAM